MSFFTPYAPWDKAAWNVLQPKRVPDDVKVVLYIDAWTMQKYNCYVDMDGHIMTEKTIPFSEVKAMCYRLQGERQRWYRLLVNEGRRHYVEVTVGSMRMARKNELFKHTVRAINFLKDDENLNDEVEYARSWVAECEKTPDAPLGAKSSTRNYMSRFIIRHVPALEGKRLCPSCLHEVDMRLSICTNCAGRMIVRGEYKDLASPSPGTPEPTEETTRSKDDDEKVKKIVEEIAKEAANEVSVEVDAQGDRDQGSGDIATEDQRPNIEEGLDIWT